MDLKREAARAGAALITSQKHIGLGEGSTIAFLVEELKNRPAVSDRVFYSSSEKTKRLLGDAGFDTGGLSQTAEMDIYFDGCDQVDYALNALKSGAGIHSMEKLLATMATEFVVLADESKYVSEFDGKHPLVVELMPEALTFIQNRITALAPGVRCAMREKDGTATLTSHGNLLMDCWLPHWNLGFSVAAEIKTLPGVLDTSLFTGICKKAVIAGAAGSRIVTAKTPGPAVTDSTNK